MQLEAVCDAEDVLVWSVTVTPAIERGKSVGVRWRTGLEKPARYQTRANEQPVV